MRMLALVSALAMFGAPLMAAPSVAYADGIERPRAPRPRPRPAPRPAPAPVPAPAIEQGPETVRLPESFFASSGGVGADIATRTYVYTSTRVIAGGRASASAFASARSFARAGGGHGGGCRC